MRLFGKKPTSTFVSFGDPVFQEEALVEPIAPQAPILKVMYGIIFVMAFALVVEVVMLLTRSDQVAEAVEQPEAAKPKVRADAISEPEVVMSELEVVTSVEPETVTKKQSADLLSPVHAVADVPVVFKPTESPVETSEPAPESEPVEKAAALSLEPVETDVESHMNALVEAALSGEYSVEVREDNGKRHLVLRPDNLTIDGDLTKSLLIVAEERGEIAFPVGSTIENGTVDLDTMLFNLVQRVLVSDGTIEGTSAAREMTQRAFVASGIR